MAPGAQARSIESAATPWRRSPFWAPLTGRSVMASLNRLATIATRSPTPERFPSNTTKGLQTPAFEEVAQAIAPGPQVVDVLLVRFDVDGDPVDDLQSVSFESASLGRVIGHQPHSGYTQVDQDLGPIPYSRLSTGRPNSTLASTVSSRPSCSS